jgi:glycosyltransferase involved in cell wall biosynthesis
VSIKNASALILVDPHLKDFAHHHFNYDMAILRAARARGMRARALIDRAATDEVVAVLQAEPVLISLSYQPIRFQLLNVLRIGPAFQFLYAVIARFLDLRKHLGPTVTRNTMIFVPTCDARNLAAWILWCACQSSASAPVVFLMLRFPCVRKDDDPLSGAIRAGYALSLRCLPWLDAAERIKLCTDSKSLAEQYGALTTRHVDILPIPHTEAFAAGPTVGREGRDPSPSIVVALGDARKEKGFDILVDAVINAASSKLGQKLAFKVHCPVHATHRDMQLHVDRLRKLALGNVHLIPEFLSAQEYYSLLDSADIVVMPYRQASYACRTSGPLIEAMAAGKIVIGTDRTWLSEAIAEYGGGVTFRDCDSEDLSRAIMTAHRDRAILLERAAHGAKAVRAEHNPEHFLDCIANIATPRPAAAASS